MRKIAMVRKRTIASELQSTSIEVLGACVDTAQFQRIDRDICSFSYLLQNERDLCTPTRQKDENEPSGGLMTYDGTLNSSSIDRKQKR